MNYTRKEVTIRFDGGIAPQNQGAKTPEALFFKRSSLSEGTKICYRSSVRLVKQWLSQRNYYDGLPWMMKHVDEYIADMASGILSRCDMKTGILSDGEPLKFNTLSKRLAAINMLHISAGFESPTRHLEVKKTFAGIARVNGRNVKKAIAALPELLIDKVSPCRYDTQSNLRDKALILIGFGGAFRISELAGLTVGDISFNEFGVDVLVKKSKDDQELFGQKKAIVFGNSVCPVLALKKYMSVINCTKDEYPLFRKAHSNGCGDISCGGLTTRTLYKIIQKWLGREYSGHSLRSGFVTSAFANGADHLKVAEVTGHKNINTLKEYLHESCRYQSHAGEGVL
jgi:site-specific recombinase XerD